MSNAYIDRWLCSYTYIYIYIYLYLRIYNYIYMCVCVCYKYHIIYKNGDYQVKQLFGTHHCTIPRRAGHLLFNQWSCLRGPIWTFAPRIRAEPVAPLHHDRQVPGLQVLEQRWPQQQLPRFKKGFKRSTAPPGAAFSCQPRAWRPDGMGANLTNTFVSTGSLESTRRVFLARFM